MEPADLTPRDNPESDPIEALLRRPIAPLPDDGFSRRVMAHLPPPSARQSRSVPLRTLVLVASAGAGIALFAMRNRSVTALEHEWASLERAVVQAGAALNQTPTLVALAVAAASLLYTFFFATPRRQ